MAARWVTCQDCGDRTKRDVTARKRKRCAECGIKHAARANLAQHYGYGQGPGDKAAKRPPKVTAARTAPGRGQSGDRPAA